MSGLNLKIPLLDDILSGDQNAPVDDVERKKRSVKYRCKRYFVNDGPKLVWILIWLALNIVYCTATYLDWRDPKKKGVAVLGVGLALAKTGAASIRLNSMLLMLTVARNFISWARWSFPRLTYYLPFDKNIIFHRYLAIAIMLGTGVHIGAHYYNFRTLGLNPDGYALLGYTTPQSEWHIAFTTLPGSTGLLILATMVFLYSAASFENRRKAFELFWYTHNILFMVFIALNVIHGLAAVFSPAQFWMWIVAPVIIYAVERIIRFIRKSQKTIILQVIAHPGDVVELRMKKLAFNYKSGMYVTLCVPYLVPFEDHPFTLSSAPEQDYFSVHIQAVGDWTKSLSKLLNPEKKLGLVQQNLVQAPDGSPIVTVDGPFGAASEEIFDAKIAVLVGAGIGVTPFASVLQSIRYRVMRAASDQYAPKVPLEKVYFFWISRDKTQFEWFSTILAELENSPFAKYLDIRIYLTGKFDPASIKAIMFNDSKSGGDALTGLHSKTRYGRPNWNVVLAELKTSHPNEDVNIFFCGPPMLSKTLYKKCTKFTEAEGQGTRFHYHKENF